MYLLGHLGFTIIIAYYLKNKKRKNINILAMLIGAMLPDMIDKPLNVLFNLPGRFIAHIILLHASILILILLLSKNTLTHSTDASERIRKNGISLELGAIIHILEDFRPGDQKWLQVALFPAFGPLPFHSEKYLFLLGYKDLYYWVTEALGLLFLLAMGVTNKWNRKQWTALVLVILAYTTTYTLAILLYLN